MNELELRLGYPLGDTLPAPGTALEVAPGVRWVRMGLPFALDHINLWLLRDEIDGRAGWSIVDCGIANDATRAAWEQVFENGTDGLPVLRVIVTHMHPDHIGLAHWLCERFGVRLWISGNDFNAARIASSALNDDRQGAVDFAISHGLTDPAVIDRLRVRGNHFAQMVPALPQRFRRLYDGDAIRIGSDPWTCIAGYGHAPEHMSLHCPAKGILISGDMVLPRISTNVSVWEMEPEADPLPRYVASLERMRSVPADTLVLPSHGRPFTGLHERIDQLVNHHDERYAEVLQACGEGPKSAADLLMVLFKRALDPHQSTFALGEAVAHVHALWYRGRLARERGADGVYRFRTV